MKLFFNLTCEACPEQYDVLDTENDNKIVAYVRFRWGHLSCTVPDVGGTVIYSAESRDNAYRGVFSTEEERVYYLEEIKQHILRHYYVQTFFKSKN